MTEILVRRHSTRIVTSTTPSPWRRRDTRGCIQGWVQAVVRGIQRSSTTPTTSGCRSSYSSRQEMPLSTVCILSILAFQTNSISIITFSLVFRFLDMTLRNENMPMIEYGKVKIILTSFLVQMCKSVHYHFNQHHALSGT